MLAVSIVVLININKYKRKSQLMVEETLGVMPYIKPIGQQMLNDKPCSHTGNQNTSYITQQQLLRWQGYIYLGASTVFD